MRHAFGAPRVAESGRKKSLDRPRARSPQSPLSSPSTQGGVLIAHPSPGARILWASTLGASDRPVFLVNGASGMLDHLARALRGRAHLPATILTGAEEHRALLESQVWVELSRREGIDVRCLDHEARAPVPDAAGQQLWASVPPAVTGASDAMAAGAAATRG